MKEWRSVNQLIRVNVMERDSHSTGDNSLTKSDIDQHCPLLSPLNASAVANQHGENFFPEIRIIK